MTDANDIPLREAFEGYKTDEGNGRSLWYKNTGPWWDSTNLKPNDGISLEEERKDSNSLFNFYRKMIRLRQSSPALSNGSYQTLQNNNGNVFSFLRKEKNTVCVVINLSDQIQTGVIDISANNLRVNSMLQLWGGEKATVSAGNISFRLPAFSMQAWELR